MWTASRRPSFFSIRFAVQRILFTLPSPLATGNVFIGTEGMIQSDPAGRILVVGLAPGTASGTGVLYQWSTGERRTPHGRTWHRQRGLDRQFGTVNPPSCASGSPERHAPRQPVQSVGNKAGRTCADSSYPRGTTHGGDRGGVGEPEPDDPLLNRCRPNDLMTVCVYRGEFGPVPGPPQSYPPDATILGMFVPPDRTAI